MRVVVDEGVPRQLAAALQRAGLDAHRFKSIWKGFTNGRLIAAVEADGFDVLNAPRPANTWRSNKMIVGEPAASAPTAGRR